MLVFTEKKSLKHHTKNAMMPRFGQDLRFFKILSDLYGFKQCISMLERISLSQGPKSDHKTHKTILVSLNVSGNHKEETWSFARWGLGLGCSSSPIRHAGSEAEGFLRAKTGERMIEVNELENT